MVRPQFAATALFRPGGLAKKGPARFVRTGLEFNWSESATSAKFRRLLSLSCLCPLSVASPPWEAAPAFRSAAPPERLTCGGGSADGLPDEALGSRRISGCGGFCRLAGAASCLAAAEAGPIAPSSPAAAWRFRRRPRCFPAEAVLRPAHLASWRVVDARFRTGHWNVLRRDTLFCPALSGRALFDGGGICSCGLIADGGRGTVLALAADYFPRAPDCGSRIASDAYNPSAVIVRRIAHSRTRALLSAGPDCNGRASFTGAHADHLHRRSCAGAALLPRCTGTGRANTTRLTGRHYRPADSCSGGLICAGRPAPITLCRTGRMLLTASRPTGADQNCF